MKTRFLGGTVLALVLSTAIASAQQASDTVAPEKATGAATARRVESKSFMVAAANPLAAEAGREVIAAGGNAIYAMVAVQTVLGLVEPQSSGLGGGAFLVYYHAKSGKLTTLDGRETAPREALSSSWMIKVSRLNSWTQSLAAVPLARRERCDFWRKPINGMEKRNGRAF